MQSFSISIIFTSLLLMNCAVLGGIVYALSGVGHTYAVQGFIIQLKAKTHIIYRINKHLLIGRKMLKTDDETISSKHCQIKKTGNKFILEDLKSKNGTFLNKKKIVRETLRCGDLITIGKSAFIFKTATQNSQHLFN